MILKVASRGSDQIIGVIHCPDYELGNSPYWNFRVCDGLKSLLLPSDFSKVPVVNVREVRLTRSSSMRDVVYVDGMDPFDLNNMEGWVFIPFYFHQIKKSTK